MCKAHRDATARYHPNYTPEKGISLKENNGFPPLHATRGRAVSHTPLASYLRSDFPWACTIRPLSMRKIRPTPLGHSVWVLTKGLCAKSNRPLELVIRIELMTSSLPMTCSTDWAIPALPPISRRLVYYIRQKKFCQYLFYFFWIFFLWA